MTTAYWQQLHLPLPGRLADAAAELLESAGAIAVTSEGEDGEDRFDLAEPTLPQWTAARLTALFDDGVALQPVIADLVRTFAVDPHACEVERIPDRDWERAWLERYRPVEITPGLWICPSWCEPPAAARVTLTMDPGLAFGTGTHPTTAMCLERLDAADLGGRTVLDFGCGSGILAIAAVRLGAARAIACDVDPRALEATRGNAARNGVADRIEVVDAREASALIDDGTVCVDVVVANILADALVELSGTLTRAIVPGGLLLLSGILHGQRERVAGAFAALEFTTYSRDEWVLLST